MATEKSIKSRVILKHDTEANWNKATNFKPKKGEVVIYEQDSSYATPRIKVGDGVNAVKDLPFLGASYETIQVSDSLMGG